MTIRDWKLEWTLKELEKEAGGANLASKLLPDVYPLQRLRQQIDSSFIHFILMWAFSCDIMAYLERRKGKLACISCSTVCCTGYRRAGMVRTVPGTVVYQYASTFILSFLITTANYHTSASVPTNQRYTRYQYSTSWGTYIHCSVWLNERWNSTDQKCH